jgi:hypothetical protein
MRILLCGGSIGLLFPAMVGFGPFPRVQAAGKNILPNHQVQAAPTKTQAKQIRRRLEAVLANRVSAGPQASTPFTSDSGQSALVTLRGNTRPEAVAKNDRGRAPEPAA